VIETIKAAEVLVKDGFDVMVYTSDEPASSPGNCG